MMTNRIKLSSTRPKKPLRIILLVLLAALVLCGGFTAAYVNDYYHAEEIAVEAMAAGDGVEISRWEDGTIVFGPQVPTAGLIFYPGGKVEYTAYAPLMRACAQRGIQQGGCHAYFGSYGAQDGDGIPTIANEEQICITADKIAQWTDKY